MISQILSNVKLWLGAILTAVIGGLYGLMRYRTSQRDKAREEAQNATREAEEVTELANTQSALSQAQQKAREEAQNEKPVTRPKPGTDFNKL